MFQKQKHCFVFVANILQCKSCIGLQSPMTGQDGKMSYRGVCFGIQEYCSILDAVIPLHCGGGPVEIL